MALRVSHQRKGGTEHPTHLREDGGEIALMFEQVHFRLLHMHGCCGALLCWVNPRLPSYCPECGKQVYPQVREGVMISDDKARLQYQEKGKDLAE
jgi:hypothetical protein